LKLLNKILLVFLVISFLTLYGGWRFIHSEKFSRDISVRVSKILTEKAGAKLNFTGVEFSLIPLSTTFKNVTISKHDPKLLDLDLKAQDLEVSFAYSSFIASEPEIDEVSLRNGSMSLVIHKKSEDDIIISELNTKQVFAKYIEFLSAIPVRLNVIILENVNLKVDQSSVHVNKLSLAPQKKQIRLKADLENIVIRDEALGKEALTFSKTRILASMERNEWKIDDLFIQKDINTLELDATLFNRGNKLVMNSKGGISANIENLFGSYKNIPEILKPMKGIIEARFDSNGVIDDPDANISFNANTVETPWIKLEKARGIISKRKHELLIQSFIANNGVELYQLKKANPFYDLRKKEFTNFHFQLYVKEAYTNTFLFSLKDSLGTLKGHLTGEVDAYLYDDRAVFEMKQKMMIRAFRLTSGDGKSDILKNNLLNLEGTKITINSDNSVDLDARISMPETILKAVGRIDSKGVNIDIKDSKINMNSLGPVAGLAISGTGPVKARISGPFDDILFDFDIDWNNFSLVELNFGKVKSTFSLSLKDLELTVHTLDGVFNKSVFTASGILGFEKGAGMDLQINFKNSSFSDAKKMYHLVFKNLKLPVNPEFNFSANYIVKGGYDVKDLRIEGQIRGTELVVSNEEAEALALKFTLDKNILSFKQLKISKARGEINANVNINLNNNFIDMVGSSKGLRLRDFNSYRRLSLEYDGDVLLDFDGNGTTADFNSRFKTRVINAFIENTPASSSNAILYLNSNDVVINAVLLGGKVKVDSLISFKTNVAAIKSSIETDDIKELLGVFSGHNIAEKGITGRIKAQLNTQISLGSLGVRRFFLDIEQLNLKKGDINLSINPRFNSIEVDEGFIKKWDLRFKDGNEFFESKGRNISNGVIAIDQRFAIKASSLEIATDYIDRASGVIKGSNTIILDKKITIKDFNLSGDDQSLKIKNLPGFITNLNYTILKKGETFEISRMNGKYGEGDFKVGGKVYFDDLYPQVNLDYRIDRAMIPLFKRSSVLVSSVGSLTGTDLPYKLNGKISFMHGEFLDDPADFMGGTKVSLDEYKKYLPEKDIFGKKGILELNVSFDTVNPLVVKNNLAEVYIKGSGQASGNITSPELNTRLDIIPNVSKFKFKGHDFVLNQGYVEIQDRGKNRISDLKFTGLARISEYDMRLDLSGSITKVNIDLSSEPALSKEDLLSLLTLGVTSDMSKNLEASERKFVTTVGIGTLLVDQLKINEDLNSSLGVKLSVQPEFKEDETTLIQGKSAVSDGSGSRLKSATKIKINKKITNKVDVSLSSTVGGSLEQKQEMNVNYNINRNFSLEGVYEVKPSEDENTNTPNSLGADLKYRWSF
jgi:translocation and assembly module TamB